MPKEDPVVEWESTILHYGAPLKFGVGPALLSGSGNHPSMLREAVPGASAQG